MRVVATVVAADGRKNILLVLLHLGDVRAPYAGTVVVAVAEGVAMATILSLSGFAFAHAHHVASFATPRADHGRGTLRLVMVAHNSTLVANNSFAFGPNMASFVAVVAKRAETLLRIDG